MLDKAKNKGFLHVKGVVLKDNIFSAKIWEKFNSTPINQTSDRCEMLIYLD